MGYAYSVLGDAADMYKRITTPLAAIPANMLTCYMSETEFNRLPSGTRALGCKIKITPKGFRTSFATQQSRLDNYQITDFGEPIQEDTRTTTSETPIIPREAEVAISIEEGTVAFQGENAILETAESSGIGGTQYDRVIDWNSIDQSGTDGPIRVQDIGDGSEFDIEEFLRSKPNFGDRYRIGPTVPATLADIDRLASGERIEGIRYGGSGDIMVSPKLWPNCWLIQQQMEEENAKLLQQANGLKKLKAAVLKTELSTTSLTFEMMNDIISLYKNYGQ